MNLVNFMEYKKKVFEKDKRTITNTKPETYISQLDGKCPKDSQYEKILDKYAISLINNKKDKPDLFDNYNNNVKHYLLNLAKGDKCKEARKINNRFIRIWSNDNEKLASAYESRWKLFFIDEKYKKAYKNAKKVYHLYQNEFGKHDYRTIGARIDVVRCYEREGGQEEINYELSKIWGDYSDFFNGSNPNIPDVIKKMIVAFGYTMWEDERVIALRQMRYEKACEVFGRGHIKSLKALSDMSSSYIYLNPDKHLSIAKQAYEECLSYLDEESDLTLLAKTKLAQAYLRNYNYYEGLKLLYEAYKKSKEIYGVQSTDALKLLNSLAEKAKVYLNNPKKLEESDKNLKTKEISQVIVNETYEVLKSIDSKDKRLYYWKGMIYGSLGEFEKAIKYIEKCYKATVLEYGETDRCSIIILSEMGLLYQGASKHREAKETYRRAWEQSYKTHGEHSILTNMMYKLYLLTPNNK